MSSRHVRLNERLVKFSYTCFMTSCIYVTCLIIDRGSIWVYMITRILRTAFTMKL